MRGAAPTVLLVGDGEPRLSALAAALERRKIFPEILVGSSGVVKAVIAAQPDLAILIGDAAEDGGAAVLRRLSAASVVSVPVVLLPRDPRLSRRVDAFLSGATAVIQWTASIDAVADNIGELLIKLPALLPEGRGLELGETTLDELAAFASQRLRRGILLVKASAGSDPRVPLRIVLGDGRSVAETLASFVERMTSLTLSAEPVQYELHVENARSSDSIAPEDLAEEDAEEILALQDLRVLLAVGSPSHADALAHELRARGSIVAVTDGQGRGLERAGDLDPEVVLLDAADFESPDFELLHVLRRDPRLRWAAIFVARWESFWANDKPRLARLARQLAPLIEDDRRLRARIETQERFYTRLEVTGPSRLLRTLCTYEEPLHITVQSKSGTADADVANGLLVGASWTPVGASTPTLTGIEALGRLVGLASGRVRIERRELPQAANVMAPVEQALAWAVQENAVLTDEPSAGDDAAEGSGTSHDVGGKRDPAVSTTGVREPRRRSISETNPMVSVPPDEDWSVHLRQTRSEIPVVLTPDDVLEQTQDYSAISGMDESSFFDQVTETSSFDDKSTHEIDETEALRENDTRRVRRHSNIRRKEGVEIPHELALTPAVGLDRALLASAGSYMSVQAREGIIETQEMNYGDVVPAPSAWARDVSGGAPANVPHSPVAFAPTLLDIPMSETAPDPAYDTPTRRPPPLFERSDAALQPLYDVRMPGVVVPPPASVDVETDFADQEYDTPVSRDEMPTFDDDTRRVFFRGELNLDPARPTSPPPPMFPDQPAANGNELVLGGSGPWLHTAPFEGGSPNQSVPTHAALIREEIAAKAVPSFGGSSIEVPPLAEEVPLLEPIPALRGLRSFPRSVRFWALTCGIVVLMLAVLWAVRAIRWNEAERAGSIRNADRTSGSNGLRLRSGAAGLLTRVAGVRSDSKPARSDASATGALESSDTLAKRAASLVEQGRIKEAEFVYLRAIDRNPHNPHAHAGIARVYLEQGRAHDAVAAAEKAVTMRHKRAAYRVLLGDALAKSGALEAARREWTQAVQLEPGDPVAQARLRDHGR